MLDLLQLLLKQDWALRWIVCVLLVLLLWQLWKFLKGLLLLTGWMWRQSKKVLFRWNWYRLAAASVLGTLVWAFSGPLADGLQEFEQQWFPVWVGQYDYLEEAHLTAIYETALAQKVDAYELEVIKTRTREMAAKIQSTPLAIYECAYLECGLQPFQIRKDGVAAGWIQFTKAGLGGLSYEGRRVSMEEVTAACKRRDIRWMMDLSELYLVDKYQRSGSRPLNNTIDLYLALFAPAHIGAAHDKVVYSGWDNPSYYLNKGLDGWYVKTQDARRPQIFRKESACDGAISIWEMYLALEAKKARLVGEYLKR